MKPRTIITQDAEVDDRNSLRHFLLYANEVELLGIVQTASKFHWRGVPGAVKPPKTHKDDFEHVSEVSGPYDAPYRWPGTEWMAQTIDDYAADYANLCQCAEGYPSPDALRALIKIGNVGYEGETEAPTEGSELIRSAILDADPRTLYVQVWGGSNTVARALMDIEAACKDCAEWQETRDRLSRKVVVTACGEQDGAFRRYIAERWPHIRFIKTLQMQSYAYPWFVMPEGESKDTLKSEFMRREILREKSALARGYATWLDGKTYPGEGAMGQFGVNPVLGEYWVKQGFTAPKPYDFLSEGDSPTFFCLLDWGFRTLEDFGYGGIAGRYARVPGEVNSKGEALDVWNVAKDLYTDRDGNATLQESMWRYVADIQRDFAARVHWASGEGAPEYAPSLTIDKGVDFTAAPGERLTFHAKAHSRDGHAVSVSFRIYADASAPCAKDAALTALCGAASVEIPTTAAAGDRIHIVAKAQTDGKYRLTRYAHIIVTVR